MDLTTPTHPVHFEGSLHLAEDWHDQLRLLLLPEEVWFIGIKLSLRSLDSLSLCQQPCCNEIPGTVRFSSDTKTAKHML